MLESVHIKSVTAGRVSMCDCVPLENTLLTANKKLEFRAFVCEYTHYSYLLLYTKSYYYSVKIHYSVTAGSKPCF